MIALALALAVTIPPRPIGYVTDNAGALSATATSRIREELRSYEATTLHHVIVWIGETTGDEPLEDWTIRAAEKWKIGRKGVDDGAILFLFMQDRRVRIEVGYGLESRLTDASAGEIIRDTIVPKLRSGDVDGAVQAGVDRMLWTITPSFAGRIQPLSRTPSDLTTAFVLVLLAFFFIAFFGIMITAMIRSKKRGSYGTDNSSFSSSSSGSSSESADSSGSSGGDFGGGGASGSW